MSKINASDGVIVGILLQLYLDSEWYPITFFLKNNGLSVRDIIVDTLGSP